MACPPCTMEYSIGRGDGVKETLGNWGFSNQVASPGHELTRIQCLLESMESLKEPPKCCPRQKGPFRVDVFPHSGPECRPCWTFPEKRPLIQYSTIAECLLTSDKKYLKYDKMFPVPGRYYALQRNDKWYKLGPLCCPQPCCPAPFCPKVTKIYNCYTCCE